MSEERRNRRLYRSRGKGEQSEGEIERVRKEECKVERSKRRGREEDGGRE